MVVAHHIAIDGWSLPVFVGELIGLYRAGGDADALPPAPRPYRDYIGWLAGRDPEVSRERWRTHLAELDGPTLLSPALTGREPRPGLPDRTEVTLDEQTTADILEAARTRGVTVNTLFQMAWAAILSTFTDRDDVVFGVTVSGRPDELSGVESMVGLFINTVPLRVRLDPSESVARQCLALQRESAQLRDHGYLSHTELRALGGLGELYDSLLVYENFPPGGLVGSEEFALDGAVLRPSALESLSHFPVTIAAHPTHGRLTVLVETLDGALGTARPDRSRAARLARRAAPAAVAGTARCATSTSRSTKSSHPTQAADTAQPHGGFHTAFTEIASQRLGSVALSWDGGELTYRQLDEAADRLAADLARRGVRAETPVPIRLRRGPDYVVAMLAVLKAGGLIVPLDPAMPDERVDEIVRQTGARLDGRRRAAGVRRHRTPARLPARGRAPRAGRLRRLHLGHHRKAQGRHRNSSRTAVLRRRSRQQHAASRSQARRADGYASHMRGRSRSTRRGSRWPLCSKGTACTSSATTFSAMPRRSSR